MNTLENAKMDEGIAMNRLKKLRARQARAADQWNQHRPWQSVAREEVPESRMNIAAVFASRELAELAPKITDAERALREARNEIARAKSGSPNL